MKAGLILLLASAVLVTFMAIHRPTITPERDSPASEPVASTPLPAPLNTSTHVDAAPGPQLSSPQIKLHGTLVNDQIKLALVSMENEEQYWINLKQYINDDFYVDDIFKDHIIVRDAGNTLAFEIHITEGGSTQELPEIMPAMPAHAWVESLPPVPGIERVESNHYRIKRDLVIRELQSGEIFKQVLIVPEKDKNGFFINRIKEGSMAEVIGLHVGDTIHKINDKPLTNITDVLDLYKNLDSLKKLDVEISRSNEVQQLHYELN